MTLPPKAYNNIVVDQETRGLITIAGPVTTIKPFASAERNRILKDPLELNRISGQTVWRPIIWPLSARLHDASHWERWAPTKRPDLSDWSAMGLHSPDCRPTTWTHSHKLPLTNSPSNPVTDCSVNSSTHTLSISFHPIIRLLKRKEELSISTSPI